MARTSKEASMIASGAMNRGYEVSARQVDYWRSTGLLPKLPSNYNEMYFNRAIRCCCELSTVVRRGPNTQGIRTVLAFRGYDDLYTRETLIEDVCSLMGQHLHAEYESDEEYRSAARTRVRNVRSNPDSPSNALRTVIRALPRPTKHGLPVYLDGERTGSDSLDMIVAEQALRLRDGSSPTADIETLVTALAPDLYGELASNTDDVGAIHTELRGTNIGLPMTDVVDQLIMFRLQDLRDTLESAENFTSVLNIARHLYPILRVMLPQRLKRLYTLAEFEQLCVLGACRVLDVNSGKEINYLSRFGSSLQRRRPNLRPNLSGLQGRPHG